MARYRWLTTEDGSATLWDEHRELAYRSLQGARTESEHVFVDGAAWPRHADATWNVLELGLGAGTNLHTTHQAAASCGARLHYTAIERDPLPDEVFAQGDAAHLASLVRAALDDGAATRGTLQLTIHRVDARHVHLPDAAFDAVYFDPFGPNDEPASWDVGMMRKMGRAMRPGGRLCTYAASRAVRDAMRAAGLVVESRPGAGRKRECTVAHKPPRGGMRGS